MLEFREFGDRHGRIENQHRVASDWLVPLRPGDRRCMARTEINVAAALRPRGQGRYAVTVDQVSPIGCRIASAGRLSVGSYAWVTFPSIEGWYSRVAWCEGDAAGLDFAQPQHPAVTRMIVDRSASV